MKFYEFGDDFEYYALIGAETEDKAIEYYNDVVCELDEESGRPVEITKEEAKEKLLDACEPEEKINEGNDFDKLVMELEPYLILIDGGLGI